MDIVQELKSVRTNQNDFQSIMAALEKEKEEMHKKLHLIRVLALAEAIEEKIKNGYFKEKNIVSLALNRGAYGFISYGFYEKDGDYADDQDLDGLGKILTNISEFKTKYANSSFESGNHNGYKIRLNKAFKEKLLNALLSDSLRKTLEYSQLYSEMDDTNNNNQVRKLKMWYMFLTN